MLYFKSIVEDKMRIYSIYIPQVFRSHLNIFNSIVNKKPIIRTSMEFRIK